MIVVISVTLLIHDGGFLLSWLEFGCNLLVWIHRMCVCSNLAAFSYFLLAKEFDGFCTWFFSDLFSEPQYIWLQAANTKSVYMMTT